MEATNDYGGFGGYGGYPNGGYYDYGGYPPYVPTVATTITRKTYSRTVTAVTTLSATRRPTLSYIGYTPVSIDLFLVMVLNLHIISNLRLE